MPKKNPLTPEILIATLKHSSLKTVLIEGKDDLQVYRLMQNDINDVLIDFQPCGGRNTLLQILEEKDSINCPLLFLCDSDLWMFVSPPEIVEKSENVITTEGYSIENELYQDGKDVIEELLEEVEIAKKQETIENICKWYAHEVKQHIADQNHRCDFDKISVLNTQYMPEGETNFTDKFLEDRNYVHTDFSQEIIDDYAAKLRGKYIFDTIEKIFQERTKPLVKFSKNQLFELIYRRVIKSKDETKILNRRKKQILDSF